MSAIRRRNTGTDNNGDSGGNQAASIQELDQLHDDSGNSIDDEKTSELVCQGDKYYQEAEESGFQKVDPLIKGLKNFVEAAGEGSQNATERLKTFFAEVPSKAQWFIDYMPKDLLAVASTILKGNSAEKEMYRIAKEMFRAMSRGASFIRKDDIEEASQLLLNAGITIDDCGKDISKINRSVKKLLQCAVSKDEKGNKIVTEEGFCLIACRYGRGEVVLTPLDLTLSEMTPQQLKEFHHSNWIKKVTDFPDQTFQYITRYLLSLIERYGVRWIWSMFSIRQVFFVLLVYFLPLVNLHLLLTTFATLIFTGSLLAMVISTLQLVANSANVSSFMEYSSVFRYFSKDARLINIDQPEDKLIKRSSLPYVTYVIATVLTLFTMSLSFHQVLIYEGLVMIAGAMGFVVFFHFQCWKSPLILLALSTRLISWWLVFLHVIQSWLFIPDIFFLFGWQMFSLSIFPGIAIDINITTLIQAPLQIALVVYYLRKYSWKNFFQGLGPFLLFMSWWLFSRYLFTECSIISLVIFIPGVICVVMAMPLLPFVISLSPFVILLYYGMLQFFAVLSLMLLLIIVGLIVVFNYRRIKEAKWLNISLDYVILINLVMLGLAIMAGTSYYNHVNHVGHLPVVSFEKYSDICNPSGVDGNYIQHQLDCMHLKGRTINVDNATVQNVEIKSVINEQLNSLSVFPRTIQSALTCLMGERVPYCGSAVGSDTCVFNGCHFDLKNLYELSIGVSLGYGLEGQLILIIPHSELTNGSKLMDLKSSTLVKFNGTLIDGMGTDRVQLLVTSLVSHDGSIKYVKSQKDFLTVEKNQLLSKCWESLSTAVSFVFEVAFGFTPSGYYN